MPKDLLSEPRDLLAESKQGQSRALSALESVGRGLTFGFLPELQAGFGNLLGLNDFSTLRRENIERQQAQQEQFPITSAAGEIAGSVPTFMVPQVGLARALPGLAKAAKATKFLGRAATAAGTGALAGGLSRPEEELQSEDVSLDLAARGQGAKRGAATGALFQAGLEPVGFVGRKAIEAAPKLAVKAAGAFKSTLGKLSKGSRRAKDLIDKTNRIGNFVLDEKIVSVGDDIQSIALKTEDKLNKVGQSISKLNERVSSKASDPNIVFNSISKLPKKGQTKLLNAMEKTDLDPTKVALELMDSADDLVAKNPKLAPIGDEIKAHVGRIAERLPTIPKNDIAAIQQFRQGVDDLINFNSPSATASAQKKATQHARRFLKNKVVKRLRVLDKVFDTEDTKALLKNNQLYENLSDVQMLAFDRFKSESGNNLISLRDFIAGSSGFGGSVARGANPFESGIMAGLTTAGARAGRRFGLPIAANIARPLSLLEPASRSPGLAGFIGGQL